jgi:hypothetical protein
MVSGKVLTLEVEGSHTVEEVHDMIESAEGVPAAEQCLFIGDGVRLERGMTIDCYEVRKETTLRLGEQRRPPPHPSRQRTTELLRELSALHDRLGRRWDELFVNHEMLESRKRALALQHGAARAVQRGKPVKDRLKLTVGGEHITTKRSLLCGAFPNSWLDAVFSGRWENALLRDPKDKKRLFVDCNPACFHVLIELCKKNRGHKPGQPVVLPKVAKELELTLHLTLRFFGLDDAFSHQETASAQERDSERFRIHHHGWYDFRAGLRRHWGTDTWTCCGSTDRSSFFCEYTQGYHLGHFDFIDKTIRGCWGTNKWTCCGSTDKYSSHCCHNSGHCEYQHDPRAGDGGSPDGNFCAQTPPALKIEPEPLPQLQSEPAAEEGVPLVSIEPEPEPEQEPEAEIELEPEVGVEIVAAEHTRFSLPIGTVDHIICARYGTLDQEGKWIDVTSVVSKQVNLDGSLDFDVSNRTMGVDPHHGVVKSLLICYACCQIWQRTPIEDYFGSAQTAARREFLALRQAIADHQAQVQRFEDEKVWIKQLCAAETAPLAPEVVQLDVMGEKTFVKRSTLMLCPDSVLARFDTETWHQYEAAYSSGDTESDSDEDNSTAVIKIDHQKYCFLKIIDQLRLVAMAQPGEPPPPPIIAEHEQANFEKMVNYYFPGREDFIVTKGALRPLGSRLRSYRRLD